MACAALCMASKVHSLQIGSFTLWANRFPKVTIDRFETSSSVCRMDEQTKSKCDGWPAITCWTSDRFGQAIWMKLKLKFEFRFDDEAFFFYFVLIFEKNKDVFDSVLFVFVSMKRQTYDHWFGWRCEWGYEKCYESDIERVDCVGPLGVIELMNEPIHIGQVWCRWCASDGRWVEGSNGDLWRLPKRPPR